VPGVGQSDALGAYGLRVRGIPGAAPWMQPQDPDAPAITIAAREARVDESPSRVDEQSANISLIGGGRLRLTRGEDVVVFDLPTVPPDADLLHPYLAPAAALIWHWRGREAFHGGAVVAPAGAVLVLGEKETGKSTTLAVLTRQLGAPVVADDLVVIDDGEAVAGPRSIDLRPDSAGSGDTVVREGERARLTLPVIPAATAIAGTVVLAWAETVTVEPLAPADRVPALASHRSYYRLRGDPATVLALAERPMFRLGRPRTPTSALAAATALLDAFS
jgi:hypothetical protein